jgi:hypothetical protein
MGVIELDGLLIDDETGELLEAELGPETLALVAARRHDAYSQEKAWERARVVYDQVLLRGQEAKQAVYKDVVVRVASGSYMKTDVPAMASLLAGRAEEQLENGTEGEAPIVLELLHVVGAATGFRRAELPETVVELYDRVTTKLFKRPWIETVPVKRAAPVAELPVGRAL